MGGRRAASVSEFVGTGKRRKDLAEKIHSGFETGSHEDVSKAAASLAKQVVPKKRLNSYLALLVPFVTDQITRETPSANLRRDVRREWSRLKKVHGLKVSRIVSQAVEQATIAVIRARR